MSARRRQLIEVRMLQLQVDNTSGALDALAAGHLCAPRSTLSLFTRGPLVGYL